MRFKYSTLFVAVVALICFASSATASVHFSQADLLGMTVDSSAGFTGTGTLTANPTYGDLQPGMSGIAGATGNLNPFTAGGTAYVFYKLSAAALASFNTAIAGGTTLSMVAHNDNNQRWDVGIWYDAGAGKVTSFASLAAGTSSGVSLAVAPVVTAAGVFVRNILAPTAADDFHASWSIPEPGTVFVWAGLMGIGGLVFKKRRSIAR